MKKKLRRRTSSFELLENRLLFAVKGVVETTALPNNLLLTPLTNQTINLGNYFTNSAATGTLVRFTTTDGNVDMMLRDNSAPQTVANFLNYINSGAYTDTLFHRNLSASSNSFIQGGGYTTDGNHIATNSPIPDEYTINNSNAIYTIGMARDPNNADSATSEFYFNMADNSLTLDKVSSTNPTGDANGYVAFGRVVNGTTGTLQTIATVPTTAATTPDVPAANIAPGAATNDVELTSASVVPSLTYQVSSSKPSIVTASLDSNNNLVLTWHATAGSATITVTATSPMTLPIGALDTFNGTVTDSFQVTADATPPSASATSIGTPTGGSTAFDFTVHFTDDNSINASTIGTGDVVITGPNNQIFNAVLKSIDSSKADDVSAIFEMTAPHTKFRGIDNGNYTITIPNGSFSDTAGNLNSAVTLGSFAVNLDGTPPTANVPSPAQPTLHSPTMSFTVTYTDPSNIDVSSLGNSNLVVIGPDDSQLPATYVSETTNGNTLTATYQFSTNDGSFSPVDNGTYTVHLNDNSVTDTLGNPMSAADIGTFAVAFDSTAPTAALVSVDPVAQNSPYANITIRYSDNVAVDASTIGNGDLVITGSDGSTATATLVSTGLTSGSTVTAQYHVAAPTGGFVPGTTYGITLPAGAITDTTENPVAVTNFGIYTVIDDKIPPVATLTTAPTATGGELRLNFTITYTDATGVDAPSILQAPVIVTGPNGFNQTATLETQSLTSGTSVAATYRITAPNGFFSNTDNGTYTVSIPSNVPNPVRDVVFNPIASTTANFNVTIPTPADGADLFPTLSSVTSTINPTSKNKATVAVANVGNLPIKGKTTIKLYVSTDDEYDSGDTLLTTAKASLNLKAGKSKNYSIKFASPLNLPSGTYHIIAVVNQDNTVSERYTKNDEASSGAVTVSAPFIDLQPTLVSPPKSLVGGKKGSATVTIVNHGNIPAKGNAVLDLFASADSTLDSSDPRLVELTKKISINPGKSVKIPLKFLLPTGLLASGSHEFLAATVSFNGDADATNNSVFSATAVPVS